MLLIRGLYVLLFRGVMRRRARARKSKTLIKDPNKLAFRLLQYFFVVALILVGLDKFFYILNNWSIYLSDFLLRMVHCQDRTFMAVIGLAEIIVGIGMAIWPRIFGYIAGIYLLEVIVNLLMNGHYYDIIVRDIGLLIAAVAVSLLSPKYAK